MLTAMQKEFCKEYAACLNGAEAARRAGYSPKYPEKKAAELMAQPKIKTYLNKLVAKRSKKTGITAEYVLTKIKETLENAERDKDYKSLLKAAELLGKHLKLFTDVQEHQFTINQMGRVTVGNVIDGGMVEEVITFNVGQEPNALDHKK